MWCELVCGVDVSPIVQDAGGVGDDHEAVPFGAFRAWESA